MTLPMSPLHTQHWPSVLQLKGVVVGTKRRTPHQTAPISWQQVPWETWRILAITQITFPLPLLDKTHKRFWGKRRRFLSFLFLFYTSFLMKDSYYRPIRWCGCVLLEGKHKSSSKSQSGGGVDCSTFWQSYTKRKRVWLLCTRRTDW